MGGPQVVEQRLLAWVFGLDVAPEHRLVDHRWRHLGGEGDGCAATGVEQAPNLGGDSCRGEAVRDSSHTLPFGLGLVVGGGVAREQSGIDQVTQGGHARGLDVARLPHRGRMGAFPGTGDGGFVDEPCWCGAAAVELEMEVSVPPGEC